MVRKSATAHPVLRLPAPPRRRTKGALKPALALLPHEHDESLHATAAEPDPVIVQARRDIDAGLVDTDMHATPGLDAELRARLVPGAGGKPLLVVPPSLAEQKADFTAEGAPPPGKVATGAPLRSTVPNPPVR